MNNILKSLVLVLLISVAIIPTQNAEAAAHSAGSVVSSSNGTIYFITEEQTRRPFTSAGAFLSYGYLSFNQVVPANSDDLALPVGSFIPPMDGSIIFSDRGSDKGTGYLITEGKKAGFTSASVFTGLGFSFANGEFGDVSFLDSTTNISNTTDPHRSGVLVNDNGTVLLVTPDSYMLGIPSEAVFNTWGYDFGKVVPANSADKGRSQFGQMVARRSGQLNQDPFGITRPQFIRDIESGLTHADSSMGITIKYPSYFTKSTFTELGYQVVLLKPSQNFWTLKNPYNSSEPVKTTETFVKISMKAGEQAQSCYDLNDTGITYSIQNTVTIDGVDYNGCLGDGGIYHLEVMRNNTLYVFETGQNFHNMQFTGNEQSAIETLLTYVKFVVAVE